MINKPVWLAHFRFWFSLLSLELHNTLIRMNHIRKVRQLLQRTHILHIYISGDWCRGVVAITQVVSGCMLGDAKTAVLRLFLC